MVDESENEPCDLAKVRFMLLKQKITNINHNVSFLMVALNSKMGIFGEDGGSNVEDESEWWLEDRGETKNQSKKESKKLSTLL